MKTATSSLHLHPLFLFIALFFSSNTVQPFYANSFNPNNYLQEHYIEYVIPNSSAFIFSSDFTYSFHEEASYDHHRQSSTTDAFVGVTSSNWLHFPAYNDASFLLNNISPQSCPPVSVHIRFIQHQSFSDCDPDQPFLV